MSLTLKKFLVYVYEKSLTVDPYVKLNKLDSIHFHDVQ